MTQEEVLSHVLKHDCFIYEQKIKDDGIYYFVRRNNTKKMAVIYPIKKGVYALPSICHICQQLGDIPTPDEAKEYVSVVKTAKEKANILTQMP